MHKMNRCCTVLADNRKFNITIHAIYAPNCPIIISATISITKNITSSSSQSPSSLSIRN